MSMVWVECLAFFGCPGTFRIAWGLVFVFVEELEWILPYPFWLKRILCISALLKSFVVNLLV